MPDYTSCLPKWSLDITPFLGLALLVYVLNYPPFIFDAFLPDVLRISVEGLILVLLLVISLQRQYFTEQVWVPPLIVILTMEVVLGGGEVSRLISLFNKLLFLFLLTSWLIDSRRALQVCIGLWVRLSYLICILALVAMVGYKTGIIPFEPIEVGRYYYLHNALLGNLIPRWFFDIPWARVTGFMIEGQHLGFILGFNVLAASNWFFDPDKRRRFVFLNVFAGLTTLSTTFYLFFFCYLLATFSFRGRKPDIPLRMIIVLVFGLGFIGVLYNHMAYSDDERIRTALLTLSVIAQSDWSSLLFGHGVHAVMTTESGWLTLLMDHGIFMLLFMALLVVRYAKHNTWLLVYLFVTQLANTAFWYPVFWLLVAMSFAASKVLRFDHAVLQTENSGGLIWHKR